MDPDNSRSSLPRQILTAGAGLAAAALLLAGWCWLKVHSLQTWSEMSFFFMPVLIGVAIGWVVRRCSPEGTFGIAGFAVTTTLLAGLAGVTLQHRISVDHFLRRVVSVAYAETLEYAKVTAPAEDDDQLRPIVSAREIAVVGRLAVGVTDEPALNFEQKRNLIHVNWIISRRQVLHGSPMGGIIGVDASIWEATRLVKNVNYVDELIAKLAAEPVADEELARFRQQEMPFLKKLRDNQMSRLEFETSLIDLTESRMNWSQLALHGLGPLSGICIVLGMILAYALARQQSDDEII